MFIKEKNRIFAVVLVLLLFASTLLSCEVEGEGSPAQEVLSSASIKRWNSDASGDEDYSVVTLSPSSLYDGTVAQRIKSVGLEIQTSSYEGFEMVQCDFSLTASLDAEVTVECYSSVDGAEQVLCGTATVQLTAGEAAPVSVSLYNGNTIWKEQTVEYELRFLPTLPLSYEPAATASEGAAKEVLDFATWVAIEYRIEGMVFYGAQTTVT
ncbi:MAG: hypothetical protein J6A83_09040 [Clostridia bacterium]|nr:hypothetical protein [Clostridia bacterium]